MPNFQADSRTNGQVTQLHAGLNGVISKITIDETLSGSLTVELMVLPGGSRVTALQYLNHGAATLDGSVAIAAQGQNFINTASNAASIVGSGPAMGDRMTSDATLTLRLTGLSGNSGATTPLTVITHYLTDQVKD